MNYPQVKINYLILKKKISENRLTYSSVREHREKTVIYKLKKKKAFRATVPKSMQWPGWTAGYKGWVSKASSILQPVLIAHITAWVLPPVRSAVALDYYRNVNNAVNCTHKVSMLQAPFENRKPDDLRWIWAGDASTVLSAARNRLSLAERFDCTKSWYCLQTPIKTLSLTGK